MAMWVAPALGKEKTISTTTVKINVECGLCPWWMVTNDFGDPLTFDCEIPSNQVYRCIRFCSPEGGCHSSSFIHTFQRTSVLHQMSSMSKWTSLSFQPQRQHQVHHLSHPSQSCFAVQPLNDAVDKNLLAVNESSLLSHISLPWPCGAANHGGGGSGGITRYFIMTRGHEIYLVLYNSNLIQQWKWSFPFTVTASLTQVSYHPCRVITGRIHSSIHVSI